MTRLNLTLDNDTFAMLENYAKKLKKPRARVARELLNEGLSRRVARERRRRLARDYAAGRAEAESLLAELEAPQLELLSDEDA